MAILMRVSSRLTRRFALLAMLLGVWPNGSLRGGEFPSGVTREVRLGSGRVAAYTIHFDRNSLRDSLRVGESLIALTSSGTLLRFEFRTVRPVRERIGTEEVTCIGRGEGETVLAGLSDGRVCRVDPATLELTEVTKLAAAPVWVGWRVAAQGKPAGLVAVTRETKKMEKGKLRWIDYRSVVNDLATGMTRQFELKVTAFLLDRAGRLWLGADRGEWGGWVAKVDLQSGTVVVIKPPRERAPAGQDFWYGVYGFVERRDSQVWAFGGMSHMGVNGAFIARVDEAEPRLMYSFRPSRVRDDKPDPGRPRMPITHIYEEKDGLLVLSYSDVFNVDSGLKSWKKLAVLHIAYRGGRPDAVSSYPAVRAVHLPQREGEPYLVATVANGYVGLKGGKGSSRAIPGQLGASGAYRVENTSEGIYVFENDAQLPLWRLGANGWEIVSLAPPMEPDPQGDTADIEKEQQEWSETRVLVGPSGAIYTVSGSEVSPGTRTTGRRKDGKTERIGRETSSLDPSLSFLTADGTLWNAYFGELKRFENGRWKVVAQRPKGGSPSGEIKPLNRNGPPWLLLDDDQHDLWQLDHGAKGENPRLSRVELGMAGRTLRIDDAIPWSPAALLVATNGGLRTYDQGAAGLAKVDIPEPPQPATVLIRDGRGRLWLGGSQGLWLFEPGAKNLEGFDRVPWVSRSEVHALAADPRDPDGVIVGLGSKGVAFIRAGQKP
jgi:hypothetical protein